MHLQLELATKSDSYDIIIWWTKQIYLSCDFVFKYTPTTAHFILTQASQLYSYFFLSYKWGSTVVKIHTSYLGGLRFISGPAVLSVEFVRFLNSPMQMLEWFPNGYTPPG